MGYAIFGACGAKGYPLFDKFSKLCPLKYDNFECREWYERLQPRDSGRGMGSIKYLAKQENPAEYKRISKLFQKITTYMSVDDLLDAFKTAEVIQTSLKQYLVFCKEKWYMLNDDNLWVEQKEPSFYVVREIRKYLDYSNIKHAELIANEEDTLVKNKLIKTGLDYLKCYKSISSASYLSVVTKFLKTHLREDTFASKLDTNAGFLAFKNGIMNLQTSEFRYGIESADFISSTIPHDYKPANATKKAYLKSVLLQILNNNPEHLEYFLSLIGFTFIGTPHLEKSLYFCVDKTSCGAGDNGKSFFFNILDKLLPNYVHKSKSNLLEESNQKVHKQLAQLKGMRLVWMDEFGKNKTNAELMKVFGDGTSYEYEVMFGTTDILDILFKPFVLTNHLPNIGVEEKAVFNRYTQISYGSHFDRTGERKEPDPENLLFIADPTLTDTILADYANEVFGLIIEYAKSYYVKGIPATPRQFLQDTQETQNSNDPFVEWFEENMEVVEGGRVGLKPLSYLYGKSVEKTREAMQRRGFKYNKELFGIGKDESGKYYKGGFEGVIIKTEMV
jgi:phage/plasmid-associated DNA primase